MRISNWLKNVLMASLFFASACTEQRSGPPPSNRDGVSNGIQEEKREVPDDTRREDETVPEPDRNDEDYIPPAERSQLGDNKYTVLVGSFDRIEPADQLSFELRMLRINNFVDRANGRWHVCVGQYPSRGLAKNVLNRVRDKGYYGAHVIGPGHAR